MCDLKVSWVPYFVCLFVLTEIHATVRKEAGSNPPVKHEEVLRGSVVSRSVNCGAAVTCDSVFPSE